MHLLHRQHCEACLLDRHRGLVCSFFANHRVDELCTGVYPRIGTCWMHNPRGLLHSCGVDGESPADSLRVLDSNANWHFFVLKQDHLSHALQGVAISVLALSAGALYGPIDGTLVAVIGYNCGGLAGFLAGRYLVRDCVMDWIRARRTALIALQVGNNLLRAGLYFTRCILNQWFVVVVN